MKQTGRRKIRVWVDLWIARIGAVWVWFWFVLWILVGIVGITEIVGGKETEPLDYAMPFICFGLAVVHIPLIRSFRRTKELVADFRLYSSAFSGAGEKNVDVICRSCGTDSQTVQKRIQEMCRRGYFTGHFDLSEQTLVFDNLGDEAYVLQCPGCGAPNAIRKNGDCCTYCGSPLKKNQIE